MKGTGLDRNGVLTAIQKAAKRLGRPPSWSELRRLTGVPESRVRAYFPTIAEAVRAAGLEPNRAGLRIRDEALLEDFAHVAARLGRSPSRSEYMREGKYSAGAFYARFRSWREVSEAANRTPLKHGGTEEAEERSGDPVIGRSGDLAMAAAGDQDLAPVVRNSESSTAHESDKAIAMQWAGAVTAIPGELAGKRRVTDAVCAMIVNTLLGADSDWQGQLSRYLGPGRQDPTADERGLTRIDSDQAIANRGAELERGAGSGSAGLARVNGDITSGGILDEGRPVMGPPFHWCALSNAPVNELGVVLLFGMLAGELGFQIEAVWGRYPDIEAKRQIRPGKWQRVKIEAEYESRNFAQHGHKPEDCDIIVCWKHNWAKCPKHIEVIELSKVVRSRVIAEIAGDLTPADENRVCRGPRDRA